MSDDRLMKASSVLSVMIIIVENHKIACCDNVTAKMKIVI